MAKISATIVAYNNYEDIKKAISTIEKYTTVEKKIYVVDNGRDISKPEFASDFISFLNGFDDVEYIDAGSNLGFGKGNNMVLDLLDSEYHAIVNPDIIFVEDAFLSIIQYMSKRNDVGAVIPVIVDENNQMQLVYREELTVVDVLIRMFCKGLFLRRVAKHTMQDRNYTQEFQVPFGQGSFLVFRTALFKQLNGFDENFFMYVEDADICKRLNQVSKLMFFPGAKVAHGWERGSHTNVNLFKYHVKSMIYFFNKWGWKWF